MNDTQIDKLIDKIRDLFMQQSFFDSFAYDMAGSEYSVYVKKETKLDIWAFMEKEIRENFVSKEEQKELEYKAIKDFAGFLKNGHYIPLGFEERIDNELALFGARYYTNEQLADISKTQESKEDFNTMLARLGIKAAEKTSEIKQDFEKRYKKATTSLQPNLDEVTTA